MKKHERVLPLPVIFTAPGRKKGFSRRLQVCWPNYLPTIHLSLFHPLALQLTLPQQTGREVHRVGQVMQPALSGQERGKGITLIQVLLALTNSHSHLEALLLLTFSYLLTQKLELWGVVGVFVIILFLKRFLATCEGEGEQGEVEELLLSCGYS